MIKPDISEITMNVLRLIEEDGKDIEDGVSYDIDGIKEYLYTEYGKKVIDKYIEDFKEENKKYDIQEPVLENTHTYKLLYMSHILLFALAVYEEINTYPIKYMYHSNNNTSIMSDLYTNTITKNKSKDIFDLYKDDINSFSLELCSYRNKLLIVVNVDCEDSDNMFQIFGCGNIVTLGNQGEEYSILFSAIPDFSLNYVYDE